MSEADTARPADQPVTINIVRSVRPGRDAEFETLMRAFIPQALNFPGHLGVHVIKPAAKSSRDYHIILKFATGEQWRGFLAWPEYVRFREVIEPLLEREAHVEELTGLESWLTVPHAAAIRPLPKWKMALVTLLGVYPSSLLIGAIVRPLMAGRPVWLQTAAFAVCMVALLTWVVMPLLTRTLAFWLYPPENDGSPRK